MNYFDFADCPDLEFWKKKLIDDCGYPDWELKDLDMETCKAIYKCHLSKDINFFLNSIMITKKQAKIESIYGGYDKEDLRERANILRKEGNKVINNSNTIISLLAFYNNTLEIEKKKIIKYTSNPKIGYLLVYSGEVCYYYQIGMEIESEITNWPNLPSKLFEDNSCLEVEQIYGIKLKREKL